MNGSSICPQHPDDVFGPVVAECARAFDFTLLFEESILSILPSAILILLAPVRLLALRKRPRIVGGSTLQLVKLVCHGPREILTTGYVLIPGAGVTGRHPRP